LSPPSYSGWGGAARRPTPTPAPTPTPTISSFRADIESYGEPCDDGSCGESDYNLFATSTARNGMFFQYDHLSWSITGPDRTVIGDPGSEGVFIVDGISAYYTNHLNTSFIDVENDSADRIEFGHVQDSSGWMAGFIMGTNQQSLSAPGARVIPSDPYNLLSGWVDANNDGYDDDLDGDNILGADGEDQGTPDGMGGFIAPFDGIPDRPAATDNDDLVRYLPVFTEFEARYNVEMQGFELMAMRRFQTADNSHFEFFYGARLLDIEDTFQFSGSGGVLDATNVSTSVRNQMVGGQVGGRWTAARGCFKLNVEGRFFAATNFQHAQQDGYTASNFTAGANLPAALTPSSFNNSVRRQEFSPMGEWRVDTVYLINQYVGFRLGYTGMAIGGYSYAAPKVNYEIPSFGMSDNGSDETVFVNAFTFGLEINR
jgi:hypothetical protein